MSLSDAVMLQPCANVTERFVYSEHYPYRTRLFNSESQSKGLGLTPLGVYCYYSLVTQFGSLPDSIRLSPFTEANHHRLKSP